ncbi:MAG: hypothetical protein JOZ42_10785 [Acetobacteraceae bacterium]|nr:hypothetical protein [Acetobacteraceae bacterium]
MEDNPEQRPESLLPYDQWTEEALRHVVSRALRFAAANGLPGEHHIYLTFRTDYPGTVIPPRLRAQYPEEMTIVLQHQFWDLRVDEAAALITVGLSFGGIPATLAIPLGAVIGFTDPHVRFGLRFQPEPVEAIEAGPEEAEEAASREEAPAQPEPEPPEKDEEAPQVVSLDAFRRRGPPRDAG